MLRLLIHNWYLFVLRGIFGVLFAMAAFSLRSLVVWPLLKAISFVALMELFGWLALLTGVFTVGAAIRSLSRDRLWWLLLIDGLGACATGAVALAVPGLNLITLIHIIVLWAFLVGACELATAARLRRHPGDEWFLALAAIGLFTLGAYLVFYLPANAQDTLHWLALYTLFSAANVLAFAFRLRSLARVPHKAIQHF